MQSVSVLSICVNTCFSFLLLYFCYVVQQSVYVVITMFHSTFWAVWGVMKVQLYIILRGIGPLILLSDCNTYLSITCQLWEFDDIPCHHPARQFYLAYEEKI